MGNLKTNMKKNISQLLFVMLMMFSASCINLKDATKADSSTTTEETAKKDAETTTATEEKNKENTTTEKETTKTTEGTKKADTTTDAEPKKLQMEQKQTIKSNLTLTPQNLTKKNY